MMTICENSATPLCGEPYPNTASPVARWTRALPRWVIYTRVSLKLLSAVAFDYVFVFRLFPLGIKNTSSWIQPKLFQYWVEESGFHILRHAWPPIWDCAEKGDFNQAGCLNCFYFHRLYLIVALNFLREVLVEFWRLFKPLFLRNCCLKALRAVPRACSKSPFSSWHEPASTLFQSLSKAVTSHGGMMFSKWLLYFSFNRTITRELLAQMRFFSLQEIKTVQQHQEKVSRFGSGWDLVEGWRGKASHSCNVRSPVLLKHTAVLLVLYLQILCRC